MKYLRINKIGIIYMILIICSLLVDQPAIIGKAILGRTRYIFNFSIILLALLPVFKNMFNSAIKIKRIQCYYILTCIIPYIAIMILSIALNIGVEKPIYSEIITTTLYWIFPVLTMYSAVALLGTKAVDYTFYALAIDYSLHLIVYFLRYGISGIFNFFTYATEYGSVLETHSVTLTLGMFVLYYLMFDKKKENRWKFIISAVFFLMGFKRIAIIAIPVSAITFLFINKRKEKVKGIINTFAIFTFLISFVYIYIIHSGILNMLILKYDINTMSRIQAFNYFNSYYNLSPSYMGTGIGFVMKELKTIGKELYGMGDLHNDILKMYIEIGFWGFSAFFINMIILQTNRLIKIHYKTGIVYFTLIIYTMILCFTDNILRYNTYLIVFYMIPLVCFLRLSKDQKFE